MNKKQITLIGCIGFFAVFSIVNFIQLNRVTTELNAIRNLEHNIHNLSSSMNDIQSTVSHSLQEFTEEQRWIRNSHYELKGVNLDEEQVEVSLSWALRDLEKEEQLFLLFRERGTGDWQQLEVDLTGGLSFQTDLTLSLKKNYETQILAVSDRRKRSDDLQDITIFEQLEGRIHADVHVHSFSGNQVDLNIMMQNYAGEHLFIQEKERLAITSALAYVYVNGELIKTIDVLEKANTVAHMPHEQMYEFFESLKFEEDVDGEVKVELIIKDGLGFEYKRENYNY